MKHAFVSRRRQLAAACAAALGLGLGADTHAAAFALIEQGVVEMGTAYAGGAAQADSPATVYFNPAGMMRLPGTQAAFGMHLVIPKAEFDNEGSQRLPGVPMTGGDGGDGGKVGMVPNFYFTHKISDTLAVGLGVNVPFGLATEYDQGWVGRYHGIDSEVETVNINPALAFRVNEMLSLGVGVSAQYIDASLTNAIDFGGLVGQPQRFDGRVKIEGDDWSFGFNVGALLELNKDTRLGIHYRSQIEHTLTGDANFTVPVPLNNPSFFPPSLRPKIAGLNAAFVDTGVESTVKLPATLSISGFHQLNPEWAVMADVTWTDWSQLPELRFEFDNPLQPDGVTTLNWDDSWRYSAGATYQPAGSRWTFRGGLAYDETPVPSARYRTPRIPDESRVWLALGVSYQATASTSIDLGYAHLFVDDPEISKDFADLETQQRGALKGSYDASVDMLAAQIRTRF
jgi:long-chain fatty acid transport protein